MAAQCSMRYTLTRQVKYGSAGRMARGETAAAPGTGKLPAEGTQARRFGKTRSAQSTALLEDYAELIADLLEGEGEARPTDIARRLGVSHAPALKTVAGLRRAGVRFRTPLRSRPAPG